MRVELYPCADKHKIGPVSECARVRKRRAIRMVAVAVVVAVVVVVMMMARG